MRPNIWLRGLALLFIILLLLGLVRRAIQSFFRPPQKITETQVSPASDIKPWLSEPVAEPVLAGTLLRGATVQYYPVAGNTRDELEASISALGTAAFGVPAKTFYRLQWHPGNPEDGTCGMAKGVATADITVGLPRWEIMPDGTDEAKQWWSYFTRQLAQHQQTHINAAVAQAQSATQEMHAGNCVTGDGLWSGINTRLAAAPHEDDVQFEAHYESILAANGQTIPQPAAPALVPMPSTPQPAFPVSPLPSQGSANFNLHLQPLDGSSAFSLESKRGQVIVLNIWATWCAPCREEEPSFETLYDQFKDQNVFFAFVTTESADHVKSFLASSKWTLPIYLANAGEVSAYVTSGIPVTFVISKKGEVVVTEQGSRDWTTPNIANNLRSLIAE